MNYQKLLEAAAFTPRSLQAPNAWVGHLPFAAWVIQEVEPRIFVELGTHCGNSYFSFCQSVDEAKLPTKCYSVDTWQGDEHAGTYGANIFTKVNAHNEKHYAKFSQLLKMFFDEAVSNFEDGSIDLLHIDGLHTYSAVRHDFETWLPKLAPGGVVMFHDTNVRERDFGVWKYWQELQAIYPSNLEFFHSYGLGVLQLENTSDKNRFSWLQSDFNEKQQLIKYFSALGLKQLERFELMEIRRNLSELTQSAAKRTRDQDLKISIQENSCEPALPRVAQMSREEMDDAEYVPQEFTAPTKRVWANMALSEETAHKPRLAMRVWRMIRELFRNLERSSRHCLRETLKR